jgi:O-antigen ligase
MYAHNIYLQMAGEVGLMGLAAFLLFLFQVFRLGFKAFYRSNEGYLRIAVLSLLACLIAFLVNGLTETSLYYSRVAMVFWYLIGAVLASDRLVSGQCAGGRLG